MQCKSSSDLCSWVFFTKIVFVEKEARLNSDFEKLKLVILLLKKLVFSPSYSSKQGCFDFQSEYLFWQI